MPEESTVTSPYFEGKVVKGVGFDPLAPPEQVFEFVGKLVFNNFVEPSEDYLAKSGGKKPLKWRQVFEAGDTIRQDGTPAVFSNSPSITQGDGVTPLGDGSAMNTLALCWKGLIGISMNPDDVRSEAYMNKWFRLRSKQLTVGRDKSGQPFQVRVYLPLELIGDTYVHQGEKRVLKPQEAQDAGVADVGIAATASVAQGTPDAEVAAKLAKLLVTAGADRKTAQDAVFADPEMKALPELWGKSIIASLTPPKAKLIDELIERGYLTENGTGKFGLGTEELTEAPASA